MRRMLRIFGWMGLGLSTILFVGTGVLWVRSIGYAEGWAYDRFEPHPEWSTGPPGTRGRLRSWTIQAIHGRLWLGSMTQAPWPEDKGRECYRRDLITADQAKQEFESLFEPGERPFNEGVERGWRFAGAGFNWHRNSIARETGRPRDERTFIAIPFWLLAAVFGLWPVCFVARRVLRRRRYGAGLCPWCGYDLRATPERCPECGRAVAAVRGLGENG